MAFVPLYQGVFDELHIIDSDNTPSIEFIQMLGQRLKLIGDACARCAGLLDKEIAELSRSDTRAGHQRPQQEPEAGR